MPFINIYRKGMKYYELADGRRGRGLMGKLLESSGIQDRDDGVISGLREEGYKANMHYFPLRGHFNAAILECNPQLRKSHLKVLRAAGYIVKKFNCSRQKERDRLREYREDYKETQERYLTETLVGN